MSHIFLNILLEDMIAWMSHISINLVWSNTALPLLCFAEKIEFSIDVVCKIRRQKIFMHLQVKKLSFIRKTLVKDRILSP